MVYAARRAHAGARCQDLAFDKRGVGPNSRRRSRIRPRLVERPFTGQRFLSLDTETSGLDPTIDRVIEVAWVHYDRGEKQSETTRLVHPQCALSARITELTGLDEDRLSKAPLFSAIADVVCDAIADVDFVVAYNAPFDRAFLANELARIGRELPQTPWLDPLVIVRELDQTKGARMNLRATCARFGIDTHTTHRALSDAQAAAALLLRLARRLAVERGGAPPLAEVLAVQARLRQRQNQLRAERERKLRSST